MEIGGLLLYLKYFSRNKVLKLTFLGALLAPFLFIFMANKMSAVQSIYKICVFIVLIILSSFTVKDEKKGALFHFPYLFYSRKEIFLYRVIVKYFILLLFALLLFGVLAVLNYLFPHVGIQLQKFLFFLFVMQYCFSWLIFLGFFSQGFTPAIFFFVFQIVEILVFPELILGVKLGKMSVALFRVFFPFNGVFTGFSIMHFGVLLCCEILILLTCLFMFVKGNLYER